VIIGGRFKAYLSKPAFATALGNFSNRCQVLLLPNAKSPKELLAEKTCGWLTLYDLACKNIQQSQRSNKQPMTYP